MDVRGWWLEGHRIIPDRWTRKGNYDLNRLGVALNAYHHHTRWVRPWFWRYIWRAPERYRYVTEDGKRRYRPYRAWHDLDPWRVRWCRIRGHPRGIIYYNFAPEAMEPDYRCKDCGEEIH